MAELRDEYLDYLNTSGLLDESRHQPNRESQQRRPSSQMRSRRPGERLPSWGGGDVDEPLIGPGDLWGPIAAKMGKETADLLVPYLMQSVSKMTPLLSKAMEAARHGSRGLRPSRSMLDDISEPEREAIYAKVAEEFSRKRASQAADDEAYLAGRKQEIDAASRKRADEFEADEELRGWSSAEPETSPKTMDALLLPEDRQVPSSTRRRVVDYDAPAPADKPTGDARQYEDIIRKLFEAGGQ